MNKQPEPGVIKPSHTLVALGGGFCGVSYDGRQQEAQGGQEKRCFRDV
jgi:hypothetical protein